MSTSHVTVLWASVRMRNCIGYCSSVSRYNVPRSLFLTICYHHPHSLSPGEAVNEMLRFARACDSLSLSLSLSLSPSLSLSLSRSLALPPSVC